METKTKVKNSEIDRPTTELGQENRETGQNSSNSGNKEVTPNRGVDGDVKEGETKEITSDPTMDKETENMGQNNKNQTTSPESKHGRRFRKGSKVHPEGEHIALQIRAKEGTEGGNTTGSKKKEIYITVDPEKKRDLGVKLLNLITQRGNEKDILALLTRGAQVDTTNVVGWQAIHYAAAENYVGVINALIEHMANPNCYDFGFRTPLHVAARRGQVDSVIALVAHGAMVETRDREGFAPLELAVSGRHVKAVETLFLFGAEPRLLDWSWARKDEKELKKDEHEILRLFDKQLPKVPGLKYGGIFWDIGFLKPGKIHEFKPCGVTLLLNKAKAPFFTSCCRMQSEYADDKSLVKSDQSPFSDTYEYRCWGLSKTATVTLTLTVEGMPCVNETIDFVSLQGKMGHVVKMVKREEDNQTVVTVTLKLSEGITRFALALKMEPEIFLITEEAVVIRPDNEPGAVIDIPKGAFQEVAELQLMVLETKDVNEEEESGSILMTNVINMFMSDEQQPHKGIDMKLPIHSRDNNDVLDMCILATSKESPDGADDWEIIEARPEESGNAVAFKIEHFSIYAGASRSKVERDKDEVVSAVKRSINRTRKVQFTVYLQTDTSKRGEFHLVVEVTSPKRSEKRRNYWQNQGYIIQEQNDGEIYEVEDRQKFVFSFHGNIANKGKEDEVFLELESKKKFKYLPLEMEAKELGPESVDLIGKLKVQMEIMIEVTKTVPVVVQDSCSCIRRKAKSVEMTTLQPKREEMCWLQFCLTFPKEGPIVPIDSTLTQEDGQSGDICEQFLIKEYDKDNTVPSLSVTRLLKISKRLNAEEVEHLGSQILSTENLTEIMETDEDTSMKAFNILIKYRGRRPHSNQVKRITDALVANNRRDLARIIEAP